MADKEQRQTVVSASAAVTMATARVRALREHVRAPHRGVALGAARQREGAEPPLFLE